MENKTIDLLDSVKDQAVRVIQSHPTDRAFYLDLRLEFEDGVGAAAQQGIIKDAEQDFAISYGIRARAKNGTLISSGYIGGVLGLEQLSSITPLLSAKADIAVKRAHVNAQKKTELKAKYPDFGKQIVEIPLGEEPVHEDVWKVGAQKNPRDVSLEELIGRVENVSKTVQAMDGLASNYIAAGTGWERKLFVNNEGSVIDQTKPHSSVFVYVTAQGKALESHYESLGNYYGAELFDGTNQHHKSLEAFAQHYAQGTIDLSNAPAAKNTGDVTVVSDPSYNVLVSHEIIGHPSEADRALKRETAWAGRAWWYRNQDDNEFQKKVGSDLLNVFSDPTLTEGYGHFKYDDEGTLGKKIWNIKEGKLNTFINSRETASILGVQANGGMRASSAHDIPIIRMTNTCIAPGETSPEEIISETRDGWYAVGQKIPSIGETRQNFRITCWKLYKIENGEVGQLYRQGGVTSDTKAFLSSVDMVGKDFRLYNVPNCGKGTPMQTMRVGNGGPTLRSTARISGSSEA
jgi:TldD protein